MLIRHMIALSLVLIAVFVSTVGAFAAEKTMVFEVSGIECARDEVAVSVAAKSVKGVLDAEAVMADRNAIVKFDDAATAPDEIIKAIEGAGSYKVEKSGEITGK